MNHIAIDATRDFFNSLLENIVFNYEIIPGVQSPRDSSEVNISLLKAALLKSYRRRYGDDINDFDEIILELNFGK